MQPLLVAVMVCILLKAAGCANNGDELRDAKRTADSLLAITMKQDHTIDSLKQRLAGDSEGNPWFNPKYDARAFLKQDIENPESFITQSLRDQPGLIPLEPVLGGKMHFTNIQVLGSQWVIAAYEDGHIMGRSIYTYQLQPGGTVQFKVLVSSRN